LANSYTTATTIFDIDTSTDEDGLEALKLAAPDNEDIIYIHNNATLTITNDISIEILTFDTGNLVIEGAIITCKFSSTTDLILAASDYIEINSGAITSEGANWALVNKGTVTMSLFSYLGYAKPCLTYSSDALIFDDMPIEMSEDNPAQMISNIPLGGTRARGKDLGRFGRQIQIQGSFSNPTRYTTHFLKLKYFATLIESFKFTWGEGSINKALIKLHPLVQRVEDVQERFFTLEISEIY
jgi:hypothetical protein